MRQRFTDEAFPNYQEIDRADYRAGNPGAVPPRVLTILPEPDEFDVLDDFDEDETEELRRGG